MGIRRLLRGRLNPHLDHSVQQMKIRSNIKPGDKVRITKLPQLNGMPAETVALFEECLGKCFTISGIGSYGHLEIEVANEPNGTFKSRSDSIWIEPDCVEQL